MTEAVAAVLGFVTGAFAFGLLPKLRKRGWFTKWRSHV
jgi:hypothetical protein